MRYLHNKNLTYTHLHESNHNKYMNAFAFYVFTIACVYMCVREQWWRCTTNVVAYFTHLPIKKQQTDKLRRGRGSGDEKKIIW